MADTLTADTETRLPPTAAGAQAFIGCDLHNARPCPATRRATPHAPDRGARIRSVARSATRPRQC